MNPYVVSVSGVWPEEKYVFNINPSVLDYRFNRMPVKFLCAPYYSEDHNLNEITYNPPQMNSLVGLSSNSNFVVTPNNLEFNSNLIPGLTFSWSPSALRKANRGNVFGTLMLNSEAPTYYGASVYPSQLFLYPLSSYIKNYYEILTSNDIFVSAYNFGELFSVIDSICSVPNLNQIEINELLPPVSTVWYSTSSLQTSSFYLFFDLENFLANSSTSNWLFSSTSITNVITSVYYALSSPYLSSRRFSLDSDVNAFYSSLGTNAYSTYLLTEQSSAVKYSTLIYQVTSQSYVLQTSTVLLNPYEFQFVDWNTGKIIKQKHNQYLSSKLQLSSLDYYQNDIPLDNIMYELSGAITYGRRPLYAFYSDLNPIYYTTVLDPEGYIIRPDTTRFEYSVEFYDFMSQPIPFIRGMGDQFDDLQLYPDRHIESSYIFKHNESAKTLTFQLLQSAINPQLPLEDAANCVLSAVLNFDTSKFEYFNTSQYVYNPDSYGTVTPVSGVRGSDLALKYMGETPYLAGTSEKIESTLLSLSSFPSANLNSPVTWSNHNRLVNWELKYPPYYYSFKNSYKKTPSYNYENKNSLNFYLSSVVIETTVNTITSTGAKYAEATLYNSVYSDFDVVELPLNIYGRQDFINFRLENLSEMLDFQKISAFLVINNSTIFYDISTSPYVPATSGVNLKLVYDLAGGGTIITIRPSLSTLVGPFEAYWATTFPLALDYNTSNYVRPIKIETLNQDLSSITLSVRSLSGGLNSDLDLSRSNLTWSYSSNDVLSIQNLTPNVPDLPLLVPGNVYLFEDANTVKITGITNQTLIVTLSSERYNTTSTAKSDSDYFDLYAQNFIDITENFSNKKNKIKRLGFTAKIPYFSKSLDLPVNCAVSWTWEYDNIPEFNLMPVSAYTDSSFTVPYKYGSVVNNANKIYFLVESDYTTTEIFKSLKINVEVYDRGEIVKGLLEYPVNSYPAPTIVSTDFTISYSKFPDVKLLSTSNGIKALTRPPNGTNAFKFLPQKLQTNNVYISTLKWQIDSYIIYDTSLTPEPTVSTIIPLSTNIIGDYETSITREFNLYNRVYKDYYNLEYLNGNSTQVVFRTEDLNNLLYKIRPDILAQNNSFLAYLSSDVSLIPTVTSLFVVSVAKYTSAFDVPTDTSFLNSYSNLYTDNTYTINSYTSTVSVFLSGNQLLYTYNNYMIDFWLSSSKTEISENYSTISYFSSLNIINNPNLLYYTTDFNLTTSLSYGLSADVVRNNLYYYNTIHLKVEDVSIPGWEILYNFEKSADIIITNEAEFTTSPVMYVVPKFSWVPSGNKKVERYLQALDVEKSFSSYFNALSGKTYANRKAGYQEYDLRINGVQDRAISAQDQLTFVFSVGEEQSILLEDQLIDTPSEYIIASGLQRDVLIKDLKLPYHPELFQNSGANLYLTAFNKYFPVDGGVTYLSMDSLTAEELTMRSYPITAVTSPRIYDPNGSLVTNPLIMSPRLSEYEPSKLLFYPKLNIINLDEGGLIQVKQVLETNPPNSPNLINFDLSTITYTLSSDYWVSSLTIPAVSSATINLFNITVGDALKPLQVSNYNISNLVLSASARVATKIPSTTFDKVSGYTGETDLWEIVYEDVIGNTENVYKFLNFKISTGNTNTGTITSYYPLATENNWILVI